ncbi:hypothetical protein JCM6882_008486 [Rhodosporidiobolus microsporus]
MLLLRRSASGLSALHGAFKQSTVPLVRSRAFSSPSAIDLFHPAWLPRPPDEAPTSPPSLPKDAPVPPATALDTPPVDHPLSDDDFDRLPPLDQTRHALDSAVPTSAPALSDPRLAALLGGIVLETLPTEERNAFYSAYHPERLEFVGDRISLLATNEMGAKLAKELGLSKENLSNVQSIKRAADSFEAYLAALFYSNGRRALLEFLGPLVKREYFRLPHRRYDALPPLRSDDSPIAQAPVTASPILEAAPLADKPLSQMWQFRNAAEAALKIVPAVERVSGAVLRCYLNATIPKCGRTKGKGRSFEQAWRAITAKMIKEPKVLLIDKSLKKPHTSSFPLKYPTLDAKRVASDLKRLAPLVTKNQGPGRLTWSLELSLPKREAIKLEGNYSTYGQAMDRLIQRCIDRGIVKLNDSDAVDSREPIVKPLVDPVLDGPALSSSSTGAVAPSAVPAAAPAVKPATSVSLSTASANPLVMDSWDDVGDRFLAELSRCDIPFTASFNPSMTFKLCLPGYSTAHAGTRQLGFEPLLERVFDLGAIRLLNSTAEPDPGYQSKAAPGMSRNALAVHAIAMQVKAAPDFTVFGLINMPKRDLASQCFNDLSRRNIPFRAFTHSKTGDNTLLLPGWESLNGYNRIVGFAPVIERAAKAGAIKLVEPSSMTLTPLSDSPAEFPDASQPSLEASARSSPPSSPPPSSPSPSFTPPPSSVLSNPVYLPTTPTTAEPQSSTPAPSPSFLPTSFPLSPPSAFPTASSAPDSRLEVPPVDHPSLAVEVQDAEGGEADVNEEMEVALETQAVEDAEAGVTDEESPVQRGVEEEEGDAEREAT